VAHTIQHLRSGITVNVLAGYRYLRLTNINQKFGKRMKRIVLSPLALALVGLSGVAHAQSSVSLYGLVDAGIGYVHNADGNQKQVGMIKCSRKFDLKL
jgi:Gram-negative porin